MQNANNEITLPDGFDGVFKFTNFTSEDFTTKWGGIEYTFPANSSTPMVIRGESPEGVQNIRKMFAKRLAQREFYKTDRVVAAENAEKPENGGKKSAVFSDSEMQGFVDKCLIPLEKGVIKMAKSQDKKMKSEEQFSSKVIDSNTSLKGGMTNEAADAAFEAMPTQ